MIKGIDVTIQVKTKTGEDEFGEPVYSEATETVHNVLYTPVTSADIVNDQTLSGSKVVYQLAIPKGDTHNWHNVVVGFNGELFKTVGNPIQGIEENIPLSWNKKVYVERYERI